MWYAERLRPRLARAVRQGRIRPGQAAALDRQMEDLLFEPSLLQRAARARGKA